jgi:hypothetical protein
MFKTVIRSIATTLALVVMLGGAAHAAQTAAPKKATAAKKSAAAGEMMIAGTIASIDATHLTINHKVKGKDESMTLVLAPTTKQEGTLEPGAKVSVRYHKENNDQVASSVRAQVATAKAKTPKAATGAKKS